MIASRVAILSGGYDTDAQDYFNRVTAAGGSLAKSTKRLVNDRIRAAKAHNYWTKINRLVWWVTDGFTGLFVPIKVGSGAATDTNSNFVSGDYSLATGLTGNGSTKKLTPGLFATSFSATDCHLAVYVGGAMASGTAIGSAAGFRIHPNLGYYSGLHHVQQTASIANTTGFFLSTRTGNTSVWYKNGTSVQSLTVATAADTAEIFIFTGPDPWAGNARGYQLGTGFTAQNALDCTNDWEAGEDALGRGVI